MNHKLRYFRIEKSVVHVVQNFMGESTEEMMSSLYEIANTIVTNILQKSRAARLDKKVKFFYKKKLPIQVSVFSGRYDYHKQNQGDKPLEVDVEIKFPTEMMYLQGGRLEVLAEEKLEVSIGLRDKVESSINISDQSEMRVEMPKVLKGVL